MTKTSKKILLGTTAIIASAWFASVAEAKVNLDIGGYVLFEAGFFDDKYRNVNERDFQTEAKILFSAKGTAQNGLEYGARILLNASTDEDLDAHEAYIWLENKCGRVEMGDSKGAAYKTQYFSKRIGLGQAVDGEYQDWLQPNSRPVVGPYAMNSFESTKITVYMPRMYGFQAGVSYAPEFDKGENVNRSKIQATAPTADVRDYADPRDSTWDNNAGTEVSARISGQERYLDRNFRDFIEVGANYLTRFQDVEFKLSGAYVHAEEKRRNGSDAERHDINAWQVGGQVEYMGWTLGGGYVDNSKSGQNESVQKADRNAWNVGLTYENGPWAVSANALFEDLGGSKKDGKYTAYGFGGQYYLAPGIKVAADLVFFERKFNADQATFLQSTDPNVNFVPTIPLTKGKQKDKGYVAVFGTQLDF